MRLHRAQTKALKLQQAGRHPSEAPELHLGRRSSVPSTIQGQKPLKGSDHAIINPWSQPFREVLGSLSLLVACLRQLPEVSTARWAVQLLFHSRRPFTHSSCTSVPQHALTRSSPVLSHSSGAGPRTFPKVALCLPMLHSLMNAAGCCGTCSVSGGGKTLDMAMSTMPWHSSA